MISVSNLALLLSLPYSHGFISPRHMNSLNSQSLSQVSGPSSALFLDFSDLFKNPWASGKIEASIQKTDQIPLTITNETPLNIKLRSPTILFHQTLPIWGRINDTF
ncbi:MAG: hypothetical protein AB8G05_10520 [Oligoflexales bacterium]